MFCQSLLYLIEPDTSLTSTLRGPASPPHSLHLLLTNRMVGKCASPAPVQPPAANHLQADTSLCGPNALFHHLGDHVKAWDYLVVLKQCWIRFPLNFCLRALIRASFLLAFVASFRRGVRCGPACCSATRLNSRTSRLRKP